jgi:hypothetical protein
MSQRDVYGWVERFKGKLTGVDAHCTGPSIITCAHQSDYLEQPKINIDKIKSELRMNQVKKRWTSVLRSNRKHFFFWCTKKLMYR